MQQIVEFIDKICSNCRNLEGFEYVLLLKEIRDIDIATDTFPKVLSKDEDIFPNLTYIQVEFCYENLNFVTLSDAAIENFTKYLTTKCPNLEKPIQIEKAEADDAFPFIVFGSCIISESEIFSYESSSISSLKESDFSISSEESEQD